MLKRDFEDNDVESKISVSNVYEYNVSEKTVDIENENERKSIVNMYSFLKEKLKFPTGVELTALSKRICKEIYLTWTF